MRKNRIALIIGTIVVVVAIMLVFNYGPTEIDDDPTIPTNLVACVSDADCIPLPSECHPLECINQIYEDNYEVPEFCTMIFVYEAAYNPEDCLCIEGSCTNINLGRTDLE